MFLASSAIWQNIWGWILLFIGAVHISGRKIAASKTNHQGLMTVKEERVKLTGPNCGWLTLCWLTTLSTSVVLHVFKANAWWPHFLLCFIKQAGWKNTLQLKNMLPSALRDIRSRGTFKPWICWNFKFHYVVTFLYVQLSILCSDNAMCMVLIGLGTNTAGDVPKSQKT